MRADEEKGKSDAVLDQVREGIASRKLKAAAVHVGLVTGDRPEVLPSTHLRKPCYDFSFL